MSELARSAWVYCGPHYGRKHRVIGARGSLIEVDYRGDRFFAPSCDVEFDFTQSTKQPGSIGAAADRRTTAVTAQPPRLSGREVAA